MAAAGEYPGILPPFGHDSVSTMEGVNTFMLQCFRQSMDVDMAVADVISTLEQAKLLTRAAQRIRDDLTIVVRTYSEPATVVGAGTQSTLSVQGSAQETETQQRDPPAAALDVSVTETVATIDADIQLDYDPISPQHPLAGALESPLQPSAGAGAETREISST